ncbi:hypothetical protein [Propionivibrio sp.]|uniref:hypothetical protein n=1 Tax=Propionivibrio sp. TaxID=2212460 RepID=UPI003BF1711A
MKKPKNYRRGAESQRKRRGTPLLLTLKPQSIHENHERHEQNQELDFFFIHLLGGHLMLIISLILFVLFVFFVDELLFLGLKVFSAKPLRLCASAVGVQVFSQPLRLQLSVRRFNRFLRPVIWHA